MLRVKRAHEILKFETWGQIGRQLIGQPYEYWTIFKSQLESKPQNQNRSGFRRNWRKAEHPVLYIRSGEVYLLKDRRDNLRPWMREAVRCLPAIQNKDSAAVTRRLADMYAISRNLCIFENENIYLAHSHQGTKKSDKYLCSFHKFLK